MTLMTHDPVSDYCSRPESCHSFVYIPSLVSLGGLYFLPFLGPGCLDFHSTADKQEQERRVNPPT